MEKEIFKGFGGVHLSLPAPEADRPDVFMNSFPVAQVKWDSPTWEEKTRACDNGTACRVNASRQCLNDVGCNTLDRSTECAACFMQRAQSGVYDGGFACVVFDHDRAYRRVKRSCRFCCLVPIVSPGGSVIVDGGQHHLPAGHMAYCEAWRLLFGEVGAVPGYCLPARTVTAIVAKVLRLPPGHYIDDFIAALLADDSTAAADLWEFLVEVLRFRLQPAKFNHGTALLYLGMELWFSRDGILFVISENRRKKYVDLLQRYLGREILLRPQASQLAGPLNWACSSVWPVRPHLSVPYPCLRHAQGGPPRAQQGFEGHPQVVAALAVGSAWGPLPVCPRGSPPGGLSGHLLLRRQHPLRPRGAAAVAHHPGGVLVQNQGPVS